MKNTDADHRKSGRRLRRWALIGSLLVTVPLLPLMPQMLGETTAFTSFAANFLFEHNLHEVVPGRLFRSAEMSRGDLEEVIREHGIKTVIDLRLDEDFRDPASQLTEGDVAALQGARYVHVPFSSRFANQEPQVLNLLKIFDTAQTPVLVHCSSGTHRSGLAAAIWLLDKEHASLDRAYDQISIRYGFFSVERRLKSFFQGQPTLDALLGEYDIASAAAPQTFRQWIESEVDKHDQEALNVTAPPPHPISLANR